MRKLLVAFGLLFLFSVGSFADDGLRIAPQALLSAINTWTGRQNFAGQIGLSNATSNTIFFGNTGLGAPGSVGEKVQLFGTSGSLSGLDYATGVNNSELWLGTPAGALVDFYFAGSLGPGISLNGVLYPKLAAAPSTAPGAGKVVIFAVAGTTGGTCKLQVQAGTSTAASTVLDNIGSGC